MTLKELGYDRIFHETIEPVKSGEFTPARVIAVHKDGCVVQGEQGTARAEITGRLMFTAASPLDYPAVGDWVTVQVFSGEGFAVIHEILPRKSLLTRKTAGKRIELQLIAANVDTALIVQSLDAGYNLRRLERYLTMAYESRVQPVVLLSKCDLLAAEVLQERVAAVRALKPDLQVVAYSAVTGAGLKGVAELLHPAETFCLLGSSGVGKTTLLNSFLGEERFATRVVREKDDKGRHTTSSRQLLRLQTGALVIDTPGMRELGNIAVRAGLQETFSEIAELGALCRYSDCSHTREHGCAVLAALKEGRISLQRYENYLKMSKESAYHALSYLEKRRQDKDFGKMVKAYKRDNGRNRP
jgi:ribosome biogenesis GTPase